MSEELQTVDNTMGIVSLVMADNTRSIRLAERMGCTRDGTHTLPDLGTLDIWVHPAPEASA